MPENTNPLRFETIYYPLWRRKIPSWLKPISDAVLRNYYPVDADRYPPDSAHAMAQHLAQWDIMQGFVDTSTIERALINSQANLIQADLSAEPEQYSGESLRLPAQWEPMEKVLISWAVIYPQLWEMHAQMAEAISQVADVEILVSQEMWAHAIWLFLSWREKADMERICFTLIPTNDIWIRDYGPIVGFDPSGKRVAVNATYAVLPQYPQSDDNNMTEHFAAHHHIPVQALDLFTEGGNVWSDGEGTLIMSEQIFYSNRYYDRARLESYLHEIFQFDKLIIAPRLTLEETGHIDLVMKLANRNTILISKAQSRSTNEALLKAKRVFERETNALGEKYEIIELPTPPLYLNWIFYSIRRAYTNALTVNGSVLVPIYKIPQDDLALKIYESAMPDYRIVPIDASKGANGGGAVHCMTKEIPRSISIRS